MTDNNKSSRSETDNETTHHNLRVMSLGQARLSLVPPINSAHQNVTPKVSPNQIPKPFSVNLIEAGKANWFRENVHGMPADVLRRHYVDYENKLLSFETNPATFPLTQSDRLEIAEILSVLSSRLDEIIPQMAMDINEKPRIPDWPEELPKHTLFVHYHFCELVDAWNINPFKRVESQGVVTIDQFAETLGISRFAFTSKEARNDFLQYYSLDDFVLETIDPKPIRNGEDTGEPLPRDPYWYLTLTNKFAKEEAHAFLDVYRSALNTLAALHEERSRAIRHDGGKVGFTCSHHFAAQESYELMRIRRAREQLGAPTHENKQP